MAAKKKSPPKKKALVKSAASSHPIFAVNSPILPEQERIVRKFLGFQNYINSQLGCIEPPNNPYELASYNDGYHGRCIRHKTNAAVGQGYDADPELMMHLDDINGEYSFQELLEKTAADFFRHGWQTVNVLKGDHTASIWHSPSIKTRIRYDYKKREVSYVRFDWEPITGLLLYVEEPAFTADEVNGIRQLNDLSRSGNTYYGDPQYLEVQDILRLNWSIVFAANRWFEHGLMADTAIIEKGMGRDESEVAALKTYLADHMTGVKNSHKIIYLQVAPDESVEFKPLNSDFPGEASSNQRLINRDEIIVAHGLFPRLVGVATAGALGGLNEVQAQFGAFKKFVNDPGQRKIERWWRQLFKDLGFPKADSFTLKALSVSTDLESMNVLSTGVGSGIIPIAEAQADWNTEKRAVQLIDYLRDLRKELHSA